MSGLLKKPEAEVDLLHAALLIAKLDNDEVDVEAYRAEVDRLARKVAQGLKRTPRRSRSWRPWIGCCSPRRAFTAAGGEYYNRSNSYLSEVLDDREGRPITLSVFVHRTGPPAERARRGRRAAGTLHRPPCAEKKGPSQLIDVYEGGVSPEPGRCRRQVRELAGRGVA